MLLASEMKFLETPPRFLFFTGKGGAGKTSVACAAALHLAGRARRVLLVSTDPASNVGQVLGITIGNTITPVDQVPGLSALEINPGQAAEAYRERIIAPVRGLLPDKELAMITEQLSGSCTTEIASFNEFTALLADESLTGRYDHVVFDTAPTGHTIRLLQLPGSWTGFLAVGKGDASCLGPLSGLEKQKAVYARAVGALKDPAQTRMVLVGRPQASRWPRSNAPAVNSGRSASPASTSSSTLSCPRRPVRTTSPGPCAPGRPAPSPPSRPRSLACRATSWPSRRRT